MRMPFRVSVEWARARRSRFSRAARGGRRRGDRSRAGGRRRATSSRRATWRRRAISTFRRPLAGGSTAADEPTKDILARLIDRSLMLAEVDRYAPPGAARPRPSTARCRSVRARFATPRSIRGRARSRRIRREYLREILRQNLRIRAYLDRALRGRPKSSGAARGRMGRGPAAPRHDHRAGLSAR